MGDQKDSMQRARSKGVTIFGVILIVGALYQMIGVYLAGYNFYCQLHQEYNGSMLQIRYAVSWGIKIAGLLLGIGILYLNDFSRKMLIVYYLFIIATVHLKHTYAAYSIHTKMLDQNLEGISSIVSFQSLTWPALIIQRGVDVVFGILLIYFFTRLDVRKQFNS
jgi:hypothetical protein